MRVLFAIYIYIYISVYKDTYLEGDKYLALKASFTIILIFIFFFHLQFNQDLECFNTFKQVESPKMNSH